jgi:hypothetical protein
MTQWIRNAGASMLLVCSAGALGLEMESQHIPLDPEQTIAFMPFASQFTSSVELLVIETPDLDERERQELGLEEEPTRTINIFTHTDSGWALRLRLQLDAAMDLIDTLRNRNGVMLAGYQNAQLQVLDEAERSFEPVLSATSMYRGVNWDSSPDIEMFRDFNDDELDDFLIPDFHGWQVSLQNDDGFPAPQLLGPPPQMTFGDTAQFVAYRAQTPYLLDENLDGLNDLAFWINGRFEVYLQQQGRFASQPLILDPDQKDVIGNFLSVTLDEEGKDEEEANQPQRVLDAVGDIDGDGYSDLIIQTMQGSGIFGLETQYEVYRGMADAENRLRFEAAPSSIIASGGIQLNNERLDLTGDGKQEFVVTSVHLSLATIISALITRSASVDVAIYKMTEGVFPEQPSLEKEIKVRFDFSNGELFIPAVLSAEVTGDGRKDLLVQKDLDTLLVYPGEPSEALFARTPIKLELELPKEREGFLVADLNGDGRDELILHVRRDERSLMSVVEFSN